MMLLTYLVMSRQPMLLLLLLLLSMWMLSRLNSTMTAWCRRWLLATWLGGVVCWEERRQSLVEGVRCPTTFTFLQLLEVLPQSGLAWHLCHGTAVIKTFISEFLQANRDILLKVFM